jgi:hypothetical protein
MKTFRIHGICFVPCEAQITVQAGDACEALDKARQAWEENKRNLIVFGSEDEWAAHSWEPSVEEVTAQA